MTTADALARRLERAIRGLSEGQYTVVGLRPNVYEVRKGADASYKVRLGALPSCTCPDWGKRGHGHVCKHIYMAMLTSKPLFYVGVRTKEGPRVYAIREGRPQPLRHIVCHSPTGFEWGYGGSGPADLSLSILADFLGNEELAKDLKGAFKWHIVAKLPRMAWILAGDILHRFIEAQGYAIPVRDEMVVMV